MHIPAHTWAAAWSPGVACNYWKAWTSPLLLHGEDQDYPGDAVTVSPVHQHGASGPGGSQEMGTGQPNHPGRQQVIT